MNSIPNNEKERVLISTTEEQSISSTEMSGNDSAKKNTSQLNDKSLPVQDTIVPNDMREHPEDIHQETKEIGDHVENSDNAGDEIPEFTLSELAMIREQFDLYDQDHSGTIDEEELTKILTNLGEQHDEKHVKDLIASVDENGNGEIDFDEFVEILRRERNSDGIYRPSLELAIMFKPEEIASIQEQFRQLDTDGSGEIDESELAALIKQLGYELSDYNLQEIISQADNDQNGTISFNEFLHIVNRMRRNDSGGSFGELLKAAAIRGILKNIANVLNSSKEAFSNWWHADEIEQERRLQEIRERRRQLKLLEEKRMAEEDANYRAEQERIAAEKKARFQFIDGFKHEILFPGDPDTYPNKGETVRVHFEGKTEDGKVFESSRKRGIPFEFKVGVGDVIQGWDIALLRMNVGECALITLSPDLAYGVKGRLPKIPPNATLIFKIEFITNHGVLEFDFHGDADADEENIDQ